METADYLFSFICGQARVFVIDGAPLPLGQRCLGLYTGSLLTALWVLGTGLWRRGLPTRGVVAVNAAMLLAAMLGGLHVVDPGPLWRFALGLWTGHVALLWLAGAAGHFRSLMQPDPREELPWRTRDTIQAMAFPVGLAALAASFPILHSLGWTLWTAIAFLGAAALAAALPTALLTTAQCGLRRRHSAQLSAALSRRGPDSP